MTRISIIIPAYNEESNVPVLRERLTALFDSAPEYEFELIVVDDHSADATFDVLKAWSEADARVRVIRLSRNFGSHAAFHSFSFTPIRAMSVLGELLVTAGFAVAAFEVVARLAGWVVAGTGYAALMTVLLVGFGLVMLILGVPTLSACQPAYAAKDLGALGS